MHIVFFSNFYPSSHSPAAGAFVRQQVEAIASKGIQTGVIAISPQKITTFFRGHQEFHSPEYKYPVISRSFINLMPLLPFYIQFKIKMLYLEAMEKYIRQHGKPDLIHAHFGLWAGAGALSVSQYFDIPYIVTEHTTYLAEKKHSHYELNLFKEIYQKASTTIAVSQPLATEIKKLNPELSVSVIPNMVDTDFFQPSSLQRDPLIFSLGNLIPQKGFDFLIRSFAAFSPKYPEVKLLIGGEGPLKKELISMAKELGIKSKIGFAGALTREQVREYMNKSALFALTSRHETFGVVFIEALSSGRPVLATSCGGPEHYINKDLGIICNPGDISCITNALLTLYENHYLYNPVVLHDYAKKHFSMHAVSENIINCYKASIKQ